MLIVNDPYSNTLYTIMQEIFQNQEYTSFYFVSAYAKKGGAERLAELLTPFIAAGRNATGIIGIDQQGTTKEAIEILMTCLPGSLFVFHDLNEFSTFHPKMYIWHGEKHAEVIIGSSNLTNGGFDTNYEVSYRLLLDLSNQNDSDEYENIIDSLLVRFQKNQDFCRLMTPELLQKLVASEAVVLENRMNFTLHKEEKRYDVAMDIHFANGLLIRREAEQKSNIRQKWLGAYYFSYKEDSNYEESGRCWEDARKFSFICARDGNNNRAQKKLQSMKENDLVLVYIPSVGYVGAGRIIGEVCTLGDLRNRKNFIGHYEGSYIVHNERDSPDYCENDFALEVEWIYAVDKDKAVKPHDWFHNQQFLCHPNNNAKWINTVEFLIESWNLN